MNIRQHQIYHTAAQQTHTKQPGKTAESQRYSFSVRSAALRQVICSQNVTNGHHEEAVQI
jgi:hypothetical protein